MSLFDAFIVYSTMTARQTYQRASQSTDESIESQRMAALLTLVERKRDGALIHARSVINDSTDDPYFNAISAFIDATLRDVDSVRARARIRSKAKFRPTFRES